MQNELAVAEYEKAVELQQGYVTAWNNLGDAYEKAKMWRWVVQLWQQVVCCCAQRRSHVLLPPVNFGHPGFAQFFGEQQAAAHGCHSLAGSVVHARP
jgi:hypothetical protein